VHCEGASVAPVRSFKTLGDKRCPWLMRPNRKAPAAAGPHCRAPSMKVVSSGGAAVRDVAYTRSPGLPVSRSPGHPPALQSRDGLASAPVTSDHTRGAHARIQGGWNSNT
jgi:hypothetical protein